MGKRGEHITFSSLAYKIPQRKELMNTQYPVQKNPPRIQIWMERGGKYQYQDSYVIFTVFNKTKFSSLQSFKVREDFNLKFTLELEGKILDFKGCENVAKVIKWLSIG